MTNKHKISAWGLKDGKDGALGATLYKKSGTEKWETTVEAYGKVSPSKYSNIPMTPGDRVRVLAPGGGGFGSPQERSRAAVEEDVREGYITEDRAKDAYGLSN